MEASLLDQFLDKVSNLEGLAAYGTLFSILVACGMGVPVPEDLTIVTAGYLAYLENINLGWAMAVCFLGVITGDFIMFTLGRIFGKKILDFRFFRFILTPDRVAYAQAKLKKNVRRICFSARFLAGLRGPIYLSAGMLGVKPRIFISYDALAALISVPTLTYVGYYFGDEIDIGLGFIRRAERYILIGLAVVGLIVVLNGLRKRLRAQVKIED
jgi:membrane protein DedA with SNARE-associated domain